MSKNFIYNIRLSSTLQMNNRILQTNVHDNQVSTFVFTPEQIQVQLSIKFIAISIATIVIITFISTLFLAYKFNYKQTLNKLSIPIAKKNELILSKNISMPNKTRYLNSSEIELQKEIDEMKTTIYINSLTFSETNATIQTQLDELKLNYDKRLNVLTNICKNYKQDLHKINQFLNNYAIPNVLPFVNGTIASNIKLCENEHNFRLLDVREGIEINVIRTLHAMGIKINFEYWERQTRYDAECALRNPQVPVITLVTDNRTFHEVPLYMMNLLFGSIIQTSDKTNITDLYKINFDNAVYRYRIQPDSASKLDMCTVSKVKLLFE